MGPMTGRAAGYCAGFGMPGVANPIRGCGMGWGRGGGGRGWRNQYRATGLPGWMRAGTGVYQGAVPFMPPVAPAPEMEKQILENQVAALQAQLDTVRKRLDEVSAHASDTKS
jgi:hypothetical protein